MVKGVEVSRQVKLSADKLIGNEPSRRWSCHLSINGTTGSSSLSFRCESPILPAFVQFSDRFSSTDKPLQCGYRVIVGSPMSNNTTKIGFEGDGKPTRHPITTSPTAAGAEKEKRRGLGRLNRLFRSFCLIWGLSFSRSLKIVQVTPMETSAWH